MIQELFQKWADETPLWLRLAIFVVWSGGTLVTLYRKDYFSFVILFLGSCMFGYGVLK